MIIHIAKGVGSGSTKLAAFDAALNHAGVANYNLIKLSSVIPENSEIVVHRGSIPKSKISGSWGDRMYVVMAEERENTPNAEAWAGIGWVQNKRTGEGLFVEHEGASEKSVRRDIKQSLEDLVKNRNGKFGKIEMVVSGTSCKNTPVCSLVVAVFQISKWD
ncbi:MAG: pyruvoyl-dependent arginine decarboxylase [Patescibacteria group bacterium]